ncbi:NigD-like protein [Bacteroides sp. 51]|uniref:NigD-like protein n=1 Tax=Bacteroides sp. 51 TaxID=2302938 RepID=UPI0013D358D2|nr:NigD-like protein [Bacteroides sp. 51]NDV84867.1 hypothetical protein [Bacteroides sp. 51]
MKKLNLYLITMIMIAIPMLQSCDDDGYPLDGFVFRMATVRVESGNTYYLEIDNGQKLWPAATAIPWYKPVDGQRVWADYTLLSDEIPNTEFAHAIKVNYLYNVLTKAVEDLTAENEEEIANDPAYIEDMWIGANYLNIQFVINIPINELHRVSLVENTLNEAPLIDEEGYICLEYRFNRADDVYTNVRRSYVSFNLGEYGPQRLADDAVKGLKVKINSIKNGEKDIVFEYKKDNTEKAVQLGNDVVNEGTE